MSNNTQVAGHVIIEDYAILGGMCAIHQFVRIGKHSFLQGGSLVERISRLTLKPADYR